MSNDKLFYISNGYMLHCGIVWYNVLMERRDVLDSRYLTSIWTVRLFSRYCDICKDLWFEIHAIHSRNLQYGIVTGLLEIYAIVNFAVFITLSFCQCVEV